MSPVLLRLDANNQSIGDLPLRDAFFNPSEISGPGIEVYLRGLAKQAHQTIDGYIVDEVRSFLFGPPGAGGFDLAALNMQRGRDHGLPRYNVVRQDFGLAPKHSFAEVCSDPLMQTKLASCYNTVDDIDVWVGALTEDHVNGAQIGELIFTILKDQFTRLRDGDRFWYQTYLPRSWVRQLESQTLNTIIRRIHRSETSCSVTFSLCRTRHSPRRSGLWANDLGSIENERLCRVTRQRLVS